MEARGSAVSLVGSLHLQLNPNTLVSQPNKQYAIYGKLLLMNTHYIPKRAKYYNKKKTNKIQLCTYFIDKNKST